MTLIQWLRDVTKDLVSFTISSLPSVYQLHSKVDSYSGYTESAKSPQDTCILVQRKKESKHRLFLLQH